MRRAPLLLALLALASCAAKEEPAGPRQFVVYFETGTAALTQEGTQIITGAATAAHDPAPSKIIVEGHADGGTANDAALADKRALAVMAALTDDGVDAKLIDKNQGVPDAALSGVGAHQVIIRLLP